MNLLMNWDIFRENSAFLYVSQVFVKSGIRAGNSGVVPRLVMSGIGVRRAAVRPEGRLPDDRRRSGSSRNDSRTARNTKRK